MCSATARRWSTYARLVIPSAGHSSLSGRVTSTRVVLTAVAPSDPDPPSRDGWKGWGWRWRCRCRWKGLALVGDREGHDEHDQEEEDPQDVEQGEAVALVPG